MGNMNSDDYWGNQIQRLIQHGVGGRLTVRSVKLFTDGLVDSLSGFLTLKKIPIGALGSFGAALLEPVSIHEHSNSSMLFLILVR